MQTALAHHQAGRLGPAQEIYRQVLAREPNHPDALHLLGLIAHQAGDNAAAVQLIERAIKLRPRAPEFYINLAIALRQLNRMYDAQRAYETAIALNPKLPEAYEGLGLLLIAAGSYPRAIQVLTTATQLRPSSPGNWSNLGLALEKAGRLTESIVASQKAIHLDPNLSAAYTNVANALRQEGRIDEAINAYRRVLQLHPNDATAGRHLLTALNFSPTIAPAQIAEEHKLWARRHAEPLRSQWLAHTNDRSPDRVLRVGYVSPDFREQVVAMFLHRVLGHHDKLKFHIVAYSDVTRPDALTEKFKATVSEWRDTAAMSDADLAGQIRADRIDILVDLMGHIEGNRLLTFARKPAPLQATWLGYPNTTGMTAMDYRITDAHADPAGLTEKFHTEQLLRLPNTLLCYGPIHQTEVAPLPALSSGQITFGCFNDLQKINAKVIALWIKLLASVPNSKLVLKARSLADLGTAHFIHQQFASHSIQSERVKLLGWEPTIDAHLQSYAQVDIALDPFPYNGTTTTCEALWHGVPVVTLAGSSHVSRVSVSILNNIGLAELIAATEQDYIDIAGRLSRDVQRLSQLRGSMRQRLQSSPLMDAANFARNLEQAYRQIWRRWCL